MKKLSGKLIAQNLLADLKDRLAALPYQPVLCDAVLGGDPVSLSYVRIKARTAKAAGIGFELMELSDALSHAEILTAIDEQQANPHVSGLIMQLPLPPQYDQQSILDHINPAIDVDCIGRANSEAFYLGQPNFMPPTAAAILEILHSLPKDFDIKHKQFLVIGQGELVGRPTTFLLKQHGYNVLTADRQTVDLPALTRQADIIISGTGQAGLINASLVKPGSIIIDAGTSETGSGISGDVDDKSLEKMPGLLSPVPGGVGPVTVAKLLSNVVLAAERRLT